MPLNLHKAKSPVDDFGHRYLWTTQSDNPVVLMVEDQEEARTQMKQVLLPTGALRNAMSVEKLIDFDWCFA